MFGYFLTGGGWLISEVDALHLALRTAAARKHHIACAIPLRSACGLHYVTLRIFLGRGGGGWGWGPFTGIFGNSRMSSTCSYTTAMNMLLILEKKYHKKGHNGIENLTKKHSAPSPKTMALKIFIHKRGIIVANPPRFKAITTWCVKHELQLLHTHKLVLSFINLPKPYPWWRGYLIQHHLKWTNQINSWVIQRQLSEMVSIWIKWYSLGFS